MNAGTFAPCKCERMNAFTRAQCKCACVHAFTHGRFGCAMLHCHGCACMVVLARCVCLTTCLLCCVVKRFWVVVRHFLPHYAFAMLRCDRLGVFVCCKCFACVALICHVRCHVCFCPCEQSTCFCSCCCLHVCMSLFVRVSNCKCL